MMVTSREDVAVISPKWLVAGAALASDGLLLSYDMRLGLAASAVSAVVLALWLYVALRYGSLSGASSGRGAMLAQVRVRESNRLDAAGRLGAQKRADAADRP